MLLRPDGAIQSFADFPPAANLAFTTISRYFQRFMRVTCAIIGGGIIGSALAFELSKRGVSGVHILDPDLEGSLSSTERNAGGVRHLWQRRVNVELARHSIALFKSVAEEVGFQSTGYLWLYGKDEVEAGKRVLEFTRSMKLNYESLSVTDIKKRYPFLDKTDDVGFAMYGVDDGLLNSNAVKQYFRNQAVARGTKLHNRLVVKSVTETPAGKTQLEVARLSSPAQAEQYLENPETFAFGNTGEETWDCDFVILCAGAWTRPLLKPLVADPYIRPFRRQISVFKAEDFDMTPYGMIVDTSHVYFHPEGGNILAGMVLKDEPEGFRFHYDPDFFESHIWPALYERSSKLEKLKHVTGWGGLYSYTPDTSGILGRIPNYQNIYEAHSFTGRGVMQSYGAAKALTELILDGKYHSIDATGLSRNRFTGPTDSLLHETLHI